MTITKEELQEAFSNGYVTLQSVADKFGVTRERIRQLRDKYGIEYKPRVPMYNHMRWDHSQWPREGVLALKKSLGYCRTSGCWHMAEPDRTLCAYHLKAMRQRNKDRTEWKKKNGFCVASGCNELATDGKHMCSQHLAELKEWSKNRRNGQ